MITLDYYDDNTVRDNAVFFTFKRIFAIVIASYLSASFSTYKLCKSKIEGNTQTAQIVFFETLLAMSLKSPENNKSESKSHSNDSRNDRSN